MRRVLDRKFPYEGTCLFTGGVCTLSPPVGAVKTVPAAPSIPQGDLLHTHTGIKSLSIPRDPRCQPRSRAWPHRAGTGRGEDKGVTPVFKTMEERQGKGTEPSSAAARRPSPEPQQAARRSAYGGTSEPCGPSPHTARPINDPNQ